MSRDGQERPRYWLREERSGDEEDEWVKGCGEKARRDKNRGEWREEKGLNYCLLPCARTEEELGSLWPLLTFSLREISHRLGLRHVAKQHAQRYFTFMQT